MHALPRSFLIDNRPQRMSGALGLSIATHVLIVAILVWLVRSMPAMATDQDAIDPVSLVFLNVEGPGGGGGGGGNKTPTPAPKAEAPGKDKLTVTPPKPPDPKPLPPKPTDPPPEQVTAPVLDVTSGALQLPGEVMAPKPPSPTDSLGSGTGSGAGTGRGSGSGSGSGSGLGPGEGGGFGGGAFHLGAGITPPKILKQTKPKYTNDAMRAKITGQVLLELVVQADGTVGDVRVAKSLDSTFGLDEEAMRTVREWRFVPGSRQGQPVPVIVLVSVSFSIW
ncbi:MAG: energy transducer TonB [Vicinamibacterales bacterium]